MYYSHVMNLSTLFLPFTTFFLCLAYIQGGYKLLNWSVYHIMDWMREIELDEYAGALQGTGLSGPVVVRITMATLVLP